MSNLGKRLLTAVIVIPVLILFFWLGGLWFLGLVEVVILLGMMEFYGMLGAKGIKAQKVLGMVGGLGIGLGAYLGELFYMVLIFSVFLFLILGFQLFHRDIKVAISTVSGTILGMVYVGWLVSHIILLRNWEGRTGRVDLGLFFVILVIAVTFLSDAGAFFIGRKWGRHKMSPEISPKKSWEGAVGAVVFGVVGGMICKIVFDQWIISTGLSFWHCGILGLILVISAIVGDVVESLFKRDAGVKDSGVIIPGHGGILDRLDSIVFTVPIAYYYLKIIF